MTLTEKCLRILAKQQRTHQTISHHKKSCKPMELYTIEAKKYKNIFLELVRKYKELKIRRFCSKGL